MPALRAGASHDQPSAPTINQVQLCFRGRMRFVFRHFPMTEVHPHAEIAAESAEFAGSAGLFWDMHDAPFENQTRLSTTTIFLIAQELGLCGMLLRRTNTQIECAAI
jgi:protein-disulfide isomerase